MADAGSRPVRLERDETPAERVDRNFQELLQELRVVQTGVQILFAFLLTIAFTTQFQRASMFQELVYVGTLLLAACATGLLIAPAAIHRLVFRMGFKAELVMIGNKLAMAGLACLLLAMTGALLLVVDWTWGRAPALAAAAFALVWFTAFWYLLPMSLRRRGRRRV